MSAKAKLRIPDNINTESGFFAALEGVKGIPFIRVPLFTYYENPNSYTRSNSSMGIFFQEDVAKGRRKASVSFFNAYSILLGRLAWVYLLICGVIAAVYPICFPFFLSEDSFSNSANILAAHLILPLAFTALISVASVIFSLARIKRCNFVGLIGFIASAASMISSMLYIYNNKYMSYQGFTPEGYPNRGCVNYGEYGNLQGGIDFADLSQEKTAIIFSLPFVLILLIIAVTFLIKIKRTKRRMFSNSDAAAIGFIGRAD
ncbi:MAG: hypothetical protein LBS74_10710 [Oscillospiraceae bacterium]|jgi:hypothetical protein|nr:hypothetical protein [Oscillospiraceae bacterium]